MSRRPTKGFLEQDHSKKPKSSYPRKANSNHQPARSVGRDLSSLPVSSETKSKLSAFGFTKPATPQKPEIRGAACSTNLLDSPSEGSRIPTPSQTITSEVGKSQLPTPRRPSKIASLENPPQTPMPRLNITELLSDPEEKLLYPDSQPEDWNEARVTWARSTPGTRPPKRCASSSPAPVRTPSSRRQHGGSSSAISSTADPAMELWKKYGTARYSDESTQQAANPATRLFAQEGVDISPSNLRRAATLPSDAVTVHTRLKRRKTASFEWTRDADTTTSGDEISGRGPNLTKRTRQARVVSLLDQVKQNMTKSASKPFSLPVSSSANELDEDMPPSSPLLPGRSQHAGTLASTSVQATGDSDSEDYGDFDDADIDMEFLKKVEEIERTASAAQSHDSPQPPVPVDSPPVLDEFNEFDEYDEVFGSIEFEQLVAQYDQPSNDVGDGPQLERTLALRR
ncbi:hypothetical protein FN846DRAFT_556690 [Sphaerosporella brunnea]|uniref:Uncharacterized protein n=1 Tax=Sphaerosporella brunnea TaxID=1250544 RepID=A0A5J5EE50_9PEZI|nr:hypothetical protein FN846DRAFT_556690 [Sphaerosporella brunnea]